MNTLEKISAEISGENAFELTRKITQFNRSPGSSGYHAATNLVRDALVEQRLQVEETRYPLDGTTVVLDRTMPLAWEPQAARISVISPVEAPIVDFDQAGSCVAWWSTSTPPGGIECEVVDVGTGERDDDYAGKDISGKVAFVSNANWHVTWSHVSELIAQKGAKGIITDFFLYPTPPVRTRERIPGAVQLLRLEFNATRSYDFWACAVDYPTGQKLREWLSGGPVRVRANVQCKTFVGYGQNVLATIAGSSLSEESVFVLAHSSTGSRPGANCASGAALLAETARALNRLILAGELPRPKRSIRFLLMTEGLGSYNYLRDHADELSRIKASYCLESVGHSQRKMNGTLYFAKAPDSTPSFINDHFDAVLERLPKHWGWVGRDAPDISPVVVSQVPYTPWSDNSTWAAHGVPSALFMSWPDEYFHSQLLTADVTDPIVFAYTGAMVAGAAYEVADAGPRQAHWLAHWLYAKSAARLHREQQSALWAENSDPARAWTGRRLNYLCRRDCQALASLSSLVAAEELPALTAEIAALQNRLLALRDLILTSHGS
jgi:hypothetical protein